MGWLSISLYFRITTCLLILRASLRPRAIALVNVFISKTPPRIHSFHYIRLPSVPNISYNNIRRQNGADQRKCMRAGHYARSPQPWRVRRNAHTRVVPLSRHKVRNIRSPVLSSSSSVRLLCGGLTVGAGTWYSPSRIFVRLFCRTNYLPRFSLLLSPLLAGVRV